MPIARLLLLRTKVVVEKQKMQSFHHRRRCALVLWTVISSDGVMDRPNVSGQNLDPSRTTKQKQQPTKVDESKHENGDDHKPTQLSQPRRGKAI